MKTTKITPELFDCDLVRKERMKLYMEMAEHFAVGNPIYGICNHIKRKLELFDAYEWDIEADKSLLICCLPELAWIKNTECSTWFGCDEEGQLERSTALLFVYYAMGGK